MNDYPSYYSILPAKVRYDDNLKANEKLLYSEITALCNKEGFCWANNNYFAKLFDVTVVSISNWISNLIKNGYLFTEIDKENGNKRHIYLNENLIPIKEKFNTPIKEKFNTPIKEKFKHNNTSSNNTSINKKNKKKDWKDDEYFKSFIDTYPKNNIGSKKEAYEVFKKLNVDKIFLKRIIKCLLDQIKSQKYAILYELSFVADFPHAVRWLRGERWDNKAIVDERYYQERSVKFKQLQQRFGSYAKEKWYKEKGYKEDINGNPKKCDKTMEQSF